MQEILLILVVALIFIGPKRLPELAKTLGKGFSEFKRATDNIQETVRKDLERERHEELKKKYPGLVPEEEPSSPPSSDGTNAATPAEGTGAAAGDAVSTAASDPYPSSVKPEPQGGSAKDAPAPKDAKNE